MEDTFRHKGLRQQLVDQIRNKGIKDERVLEAINKVPRHLFVDGALDRAAYEDRALGINAGQTISQPYTVAYMTQLLEVKKGDKILEVGTGSGYQAAVLFEMGAKVFTIERQKELYVNTRQLLEEIGYRPHMFYGDGYEGKPTYGPFDKIIITAGAPEIPKTLLEQLKIGGKLVAPQGDVNRQVMVSVVRVDEKDYKRSEHGYFVFVPMLKGVEK